MRIAYVGPFDFPSSSANSLRVKGVAEALSKCGAQVTIYAGATPNANREGWLSNQVRYRAVGEYEDGLFSGMHRGLRGLVIGDVTVNVLEAEALPPDLVVVYGTHLGYLLRLQSYCKRHSIPLLVDAVEWYDPRSLPGGVFGPFSFANEISMRYVAQKANGLFVISRYLQRYYEAKGRSTLRLPPLFPRLAGRASQFREEDSLLHICYSGSPGQKEDFRTLFCGLVIAHKEGLRFVVHMIGLTRTSVDEDLLSDVTELSAGSRLRFYGRVENAAAQEIVSRCDFAVLLRADRRVTRAGFPSKVAESLRLGTPVLANLSSNLDEYLTDGENSLLIADRTPSAVVNALRRATALSDTDLTIMKAKAYRSGDLFFSTESYRVEIANFLHQACYGR